MVREGSKACPGGLLARILAVGGRSGSSETGFETAILELKSDLASWMAIRKFSKNRKLLRIES